MSSLLVIDGSQGEGGGQVLRTALALALCTGRPLRIERIRAGRANPGLRRQHLTAVAAAAAVGGADVSGARLGARELTFRPGPVQSGNYHFAVGTAGSCTLVLQTVLPPLLIAAGPSELLLEGGTHNPHAPPVDFLVSAFLPLLRRMGAQVDATLERAGFHPAGGGRLRVRIIPAALSRLDLPVRGALRGRRARALLANLPRHIAERELQVVAAVLGWPPESLTVEEVAAAGPGNALLLELESEGMTEVFTGFGERGVPAEQVAGGAVRQAREYLAAGVPVGRHLADQLLLPLALAGGGAFRTLSPTLHTTTNAAVIRHFLPVAIAMAADAAGNWQIRVD